MTARGSRQKWHLERCPRVYAAYPKGVGLDVQSLSSRMPDGAGYE